MADNRKSTLIAKSVAARKLSISSTNYLPHDSVYVHPCAVDCRKVGVIFVEYQGQLGASQHDRFNTVTPAEHIGNLAKSRRVLFGPSSGIHNLDISTVDTIDLLRSGLDHVDVVKLAKEPALDGKARSEQGDPAQSARVDVTHGFVEEADERQLRPLLYLGHANVRGDRSDSRDISASTCQTVGKTRKILSQVGQLSISNMRENAVYIGVSDEHAGDKFAGSAVFNDR